MRSFQITSIIALVGLASARINLGNDALGNNFMWIDGDDACTAKKIPDCGVGITLANDFTFNLQGCQAGRRFILNGDGTFNSACVVLGKPVPTSCGIEQTQTC